jgi:hypothetical protein
MTRLLQSKSGNTGFTVSERFNQPLGREARILNSKYNLSISGKPEFKETIFKGSNIPVHQHISRLVNGFYTERFFCKLPLTGGEDMVYSGVRLFYIGGDGDVHFVFWKGYPFDFPIGELEYDFPRIYGGFDILLGPFPFVGDFNGLHCINILQHSFI